MVTKVCVDTAEIKMSKAGRILQSAQCHEDERSQRLAATNLELLLLRGRLVGPRRRAEMLRHRSAATRPSDRFAATLGRAAAFFWQQPRGNRVLAYYQAFQA